MMKSLVLTGVLIIASFGLGACRQDENAGGGVAGAGSPLDAQLRGLLDMNRITPIDAGPSHGEAKVELGQALMFDKMLSGRGNISCATCHHPARALGDGLSVPIGEGGVGLGSERSLGDGHLIPRNAPEVFNRGSVEWVSMFWDSRVGIDPMNGRIRTPAGMDTPPGLESVLAAQALFPLTSREEMRGQADDGSDGNDLAECADDDFACIWDGVVDRIRAVPEYVALFEAAYPEITGPAQITITQVANAIAAFEATEWSFFDTPWDAYVAGDDEALTEEAKRGAALFFGRARCSSCHAGPLFTDQLHHNIAAPQVGPGKGDGATINGQSDDFGLAHETGRTADRYRFRTPPLRNVAATAPYLHSGAYSSLADVVRHYRNPAGALENYDISMAGDANIAALGTRDENDPGWRPAVLGGLAPQLTPPIQLNDREVDELVAFLASLTSPTLFELEDTIPASVPSGCPVGEGEGTCPGSVLD